MQAGHSVYIYFNESQPQYLKILVATATGPGLFRELILAQLYWGSKFLSLVKLTSSLIRGQLLMEMMDGRLGKIEKV